MGTENPNRANNLQGPTTTPFAAPRANMPISSSHPMVGSQPSAFRPTSVPAMPNTSPFSSPGPTSGSGNPGFRPMQPGRATPSYGPPTTGPPQRVPAPQFSSTSQPPPSQTSHVGQPILPPSMRPPPPSYVPPVPMGSPPQSLYNAQSSNNPPRSFVDSPYSASGPNVQPPPPSTRPTYPGYPGIQSNQVNPPPPPPSVYSQGGYAPSQPAMPAPFSSHQGGYGQVPPVAPSAGMYGGGSAPPTGVMSGLAEDFCSLSLGSTPGSFDGGLDAKALPRPLDGDVEPSSFAGMYPMNCDSRYLRLTTSAIPNSQSLVSRWQLPLGAVVCPLAETPEGVSIHSLKIN